MRQSIELQPQLDKTSELLSPNYLRSAIQRRRYASNKNIVYNWTSYCKSFKMNTSWAQKYKVHERKASSQFPSLLVKLLSVYKRGITK